MFERQKPRSKRNTRALILASQSRLKEFEGLNRNDVELVNTVARRYLLNKQAGVEDRKNEKIWQSLLPKPLWPAFKKTVGIK